MTFLLTPEALAQFGKTKARVQQRIPVRKIRIKQPDKQNSATGKILFFIGFSYE